MSILLPNSLFSFSLLISHLVLFCRCMYVFLSRSLPLCLHLYLLSSVCLCVVLYIYMYKAYYEMFIQRNTLITCNWSLPRLLILPSTCTISISSPEYIVSYTHIFVIKLNLIQLKHIVFCYLICD